MENARLDRIEQMLQVTVEAICSLATEVTGKTMLIGPSNLEDDVAAGPDSENIKWVEPGPSDVPSESCPKPPAFGS